MFCKNCGNNLELGERICPKCGTSSDDVNDNSYNDIDDNNEITSNKNIDSNNDIDNNISKKVGKKFWLCLLLGEFVLFLLLLFISLMSLISSNQNLDFHKFNSVMKDNDYVVDKMSIYSNNLVKDYYVALKDNNQIDFVVTSDVEISNSIFNQFKFQIKKGKATSHLEDVSSDNYSKYAITTGDKSYVVVKDGNVVLYGVFKSEDRAELNEIFSSLGYGSNIGIIVLYIMFILLFALVTVVYWKIFVKAGFKGWYSLIPLYNLYIMIKIAYGNGKYLLLFLVPFANIVFIVMLWYKLAKAFGKSNAFAICSVFLSFITLQIIAFDDSKYVGNIL